jgi:2-succinyl-6-hydroxy-2,4-cyclohexadiene-1-carboxylate synthase
MSFVFLHGFTGDGDAWAPVVERLGRPRALCPDLLGHGATGEADGFDGEADRLAELVRAAGLAAPHLVGYSLGARVALALLVRHPDRFARATLIGVNPGIAEPGERAERVRGDERWAQLIEREGLERFADAWQAQPLFASQARLAPETLAAQRARRLRHSPAGLARSLRRLGLGQMPNYWPLLPSIRQPLQLVVGGDDAKFREIAERIAALRPCTLTVVAGAGHNVALERPDAVAAALVG